MVMGAVAYLAKVRYECCKCKLIFEGVRKKETRCEGVQKATAGGGDTVFFVINVLLIII